MRRLLTLVAEALAPARPVTVDEEAGTLDLTSTLPGPPLLVLVREEAATVTCYALLPVEVHPHHRAVGLVELVVDEVDDPFEVVGAVSAGVVVAHWSAPSLIGTMRPLLT